MISNSTIIVDCHNVGWSSAYAMAGLEFDGVPVNVLYGFFKSLLHAGQYIDEKPVTVVFCWDSRQSRRKLLYPDYKCGRNKKEFSLQDEEIRKSTIKQLNLLRDEIIPEIGFKNTFIKTGFEADDIIACITKNYPDNKHLILSTDSDLLQLLTDNVSIYNSKNDTVITKSSFIDKYEINPSEWALVKAIAGCQTDDVPGVPGIGEKSAINYLLGHLRKGKKLTSIEQAFDTKEYNRDKKLVTLPFKNLQFTLTSDVIRSRLFFAMCKKYNFLSLMRKDVRNKWYTLLGLV